MITISEAAKKRVEEMILTEQYGGDYFVRVSVTQGGCSGLAYDLKFDNIIVPSDEIFMDKDIKIVVDAKSLLYLLGTELDFSEGLNGKGFYFNNPNASRTCSCGESFSL